VHTCVTCVTGFHIRFKRHGFELNVTVRLSRYDTSELMLDPHSDGDVTDCDECGSDVSDTDLHDEEEQ
jgi:hypothetical protein